MADVTPTIVNDGRLHRLPNGKYYISVGGQVTYVSPRAMGEPSPTDTSGFFHQRPQFNQESGQFETPFDWGKLLSLGVGGGLGLGALNALSAVGGTAAGSGGASSATAAGVLPSHATVGSVGNLATGLTSGAGMASGSGLTGFLENLGKGTTADVVRGGIHKALGNGPGAGNTSQPGSSPSDGGGGKMAQALALIGGMLAAQMLAKRNEKNPVPPELSQLLQMSMARQASQNPLFDATNRGIYQMLPTFAREGTSMPGTTGTSIPPAAVTAPNDGGGGIDPKLLALLSGLGGLGIGGLLTGTNPYGEIIRKIKAAISGGGRDTVQGPNVPDLNRGPGGLPIGNPDIPDFTGWPFENLPGYGMPLPPAPLPSGPNTGIDWGSLPGYGTQPQ